MVSFILLCVSPAAYCDVLYVCMYVCYWNRRRGVGGATGGSGEQIPEFVRQTPSYSTAAHHNTYILSSYKFVLFLSLIGDIVW